MGKAIIRWWRPTPERHVAAMEWQNPPPSGPVAFDPSLRTAGELTAEARAAPRVPSPPKAA